ncbi:beta-ketoacyl synthase N-terminal-like domain-containing protein [Oleomonas cavernae]|nr:beta-ketoacyl synthase N-terminal-like domain-containing protein [Oleomonas cavernae]
MTREVVITGQGLLSPLGQDLSATWAGLHDPAAVAAAARTDVMPPFTVYPMAPPPVDKYVPKRGDQRAMGPFMLQGCVAAGMAMEQAGLLGNQDLLKQINLMVGVGGGERDEAVDEAILAALNGASDGNLLAEQLQTELRPTLFLAQLPNLFAGNISIVLGVSGSSRTFMGEESAGIDAVRVAYERIASGQADLFLVGSAFNAVRQDISLLYHAGGYLLQDPGLPFWRRPRAGMALGSAGAFVVLESREHAQARGVTPLPGWPAWSTTGAAANQAKRRRMPGVNGRPWRPGRGLPCCRVPPVSARSPPRSMPSCMNWCRVRPAPRFARRRWPWAPAWNAPS